MRLNIDLPQEFVELCKYDNVNPKTVLRGFIADLAEIQNWKFPAPAQGRMPRPNDGYQSNGSDERRLAREYYERVGYPYTRESRQPGNRGGR
jgi:hypothetical protein